jgi:hypothetical protein
VSAVQKVMRKTQIEAEAELRFISKETGLITEERIGETFRFIHLTFCEFFAAVETIQARAEGWDEIVNLQKSFQGSAAALRSRLAEVLPFACALMARHMQSAAIDDLEKLGDDRILALAFLESKGYDHPSWKKFVARLKNDLLTNSNALNNTWLRDVHLFIVVCGDAIRSTSDHETMLLLQTFFEQLSKNGDNSIHRLIESYARQDAAAAFRVAVLCGVDILRKLPHVIVNKCDQPPFLSIALQRASQEPYRLDEWSHALAEGLLRSPAVASALSRSDTSLWKAQTQLVPTAKRWHIGTVQTPTTECLSCACHFGSLNADAYPLVQCFRNIRAPEQRISLYPRFRLMILVFTFLFLSASFYVFAKINDKILGLMFVYIIGVIMVFEYSAIVKRYYTELVVGWRLRAVIGSGDWIKDVGVFNTTLVRLIASEMRLVPFFVFFRIVLNEREQFEFQKIVALKSRNYLTRGRAEVHTRQLC